MRLLNNDCVGRIAKFDARSGQRQAVRCLNYNALEIRRSLLLRDGAVGTKSAARVSSKILIGVV